MTSVLEHGRLLNESLEYPRATHTLAYTDLVNENSLVGDFNFPDVSWKDNTAERKQPRRSLEWVEDNFLTQLVSEATRDGALLDFLLVNREGLGEHVDVGRQILGLVITN